MENGIWPGFEKLFVIFIASCKETFQKEEILF